MHSVKERLLEDGMPMAKTFADSYCEFLNGKHENAYWLQGFVCGLQSAGYLTLDDVIEVQREINHVLMRR